MGGSWAFPPIWCSTYKGKGCQILLEHGTVRVADDTLMEMDIGEDVLMFVDPNVDTQDEPTSPILR